MEGGNEQRVATKFCFKAGLSATETPVLVQKAYGNEAVNGSKGFKWYSRFRDGRELVKDDERGESYFLAVGPPWVRRGTEPSFMMTDWIIPLLVINLLRVVTIS